MASLQELNKLGQSAWYDNIRRALLEHGEMQKLIDAGVTGVTSNPTIFEKAIVGSADYDDDLRQMAPDTPPGEIYETLAVADIQRTADMLRPIYDNTNGIDGYVSLEVSPTLAHNTEGTVAEAKRLFATVDRPNVMIKIPATAEGIPAIAQAIGAGININVTLLFSLEQYDAVAHAYLQGLETLADAGGDLSKVASVASFFISRIDALVDKELEEKGATDFQGTIGIANAKLAYAHFREVFSSSARWADLVAKGARVQRLLWASTGVKNPLYPDTMYVDGLIGPDTINTMPPATLYAFMDHGEISATLVADLDDAREELSRLERAGVKMELITQKLQDDGVTAFAQSFDSLMSGIAEKRERLLADQGFYSASLDDYQSQIDAALARLRDDEVLKRIWSHDHTVWKPEPTEITNRVDWLHMPDVMVGEIETINAFVAEVRAAGFTQALLLGMGGSSLAPEVFRLTYGVEEGYLDLAVLDSTDPGAVLAQARQLDLEHTLFIVSTKSGGTVETFSFFKYFYHVMLDAVGETNAGAHFVAITDPGSGLVDTANKYGFRKIFLNNPNIGGRYSALSHFGLVPAALVGVDLVEFLDRAQLVAVNCDTANCPAGGDNSAAWLGTVMGQLALQGRDKVTMFVSPPVASFSTWAEQLIAESTGKEGKGILPVADEPVGPPEVYGNDRLFIYLRLNGDTTYDEAVEKLRQAGHPVVQIHMRDLYDLSGEFFRWELATAIAGAQLGINPFDQPDVESAKVLAREMVAAYQKEGTLPELTPMLEAEGISVYGGVNASSLDLALQAFTGLTKQGDYISIQAYVQPTAATTEALQRLQAHLRDMLHAATTVGYGPRFLHSTGQLHKGDAGNGLFIQFTSDSPEDAPIPDEAGKPESAMSFQVLKMSQSLGDRQALLDNNRRVIRFHLGDDVVGGLNKLY